jgi:hypothetical protein
VVEKVEVLEHLRNSDHNIIVWKLICDVSIGKVNSKLDCFIKEIMRE